MSWWAPSVPRTHLKTAKRSLIKNLIPPSRKIQIKNSVAARHPLSTPSAHLWAPRKRCILRKKSWTPATSFTGSRRPKQRTEIPENFQSYSFFLPSFSGSFRSDIYTYVFMCLKIYMRIGEGVNCLASQFALEIKKLEGPGIDMAELKFLPSLQSV